MTSTSVALACGLALHLSGASVVAAGTQAIQALGSEPGKPALVFKRSLNAALAVQIGRASCRERVYVLV